MEFKFHTTSPAGIPVYVAVGTVGLAAFCTRTTNITPSVTGLDRTTDFCIVLDAPLLKMSKKQFAALIAHEEAHALYGHIDDENAAKNEQGILIVPEFEIQADAHAAKLVSARAMRGALGFIQGAYWVGAVIAWLHKQVTWSEMRTMQKNIKQELEPRLKALKALKA